MTSWSMFAEKLVSKPVRMGLREFAASRSSLLVLNSMLHASHSHVLQFFHWQSIVTCLLVDAVLVMHK